MPTSDIPAPPTIGRPVTDTTYPDAYRRDPLHVAKAVDDLQRALNEARHSTRVPATTHPTNVARLSSLHSALATLTAHIGDEIATRADTHPPTTASRQTTRMLINAAQYAGDALTHLVQAIGIAYPLDALNASPAGQRSREQRTEHLVYRLDATTTELRHLTTALRRDNLASGYTYPHPTVAVTGIEPDTAHTRAESAPDATAREAARRRSPIHPHPSPTPTAGSPDLAAEPQLPAHRGPRGGHR